MESCFGMGRCLRWLVGGLTVVTTIHFVLWSPDTFPPSKIDFATILQNFPMPINKFSGFQRRSNFSANSFFLCDWTTVLHP